MSTKDQILQGLNVYTPLLKNDLKKSFVEKVTGKNLSTNDFTDALKNKLDSIEGGAEKNKINAVSIQGADFYFNTDTKVANITIQSAEANNFSINGAEVQQVSLSGEGFVIDSTNKIANVTLSSGIESVSVVSEVGNASIDNKKLFLNFPDASNFSINGAEVQQVSLSGGGFVIDSTNKIANITLSSGEESSKLNPNFTITPTAVTLGAGDVATLNVNKISPAPFQTYISNASACNASVTADKVILTGKQIYSQTDLSCNFALLETQNFKPAFVDVPVTVKQFDALRVLCHFNDSENPYLNEISGYTITSIANLPTIGAGYGKFGNGASGTGSQARVENLYLGGQDFTVDFWAKFSDSQYGLVIFAGSWEDNTQNIFAFSKSGFNFVTNTESQITMPSTYTSAHHHYAIDYDHEAKIGRFFIDGVLTCSQEVEIARNSSPLQMAFGHWYSTCMSQFYLDELRILNGSCEWTENFTPPTEPYV